MTKKEKLICMAYTGITFIEFSEYHKFITRLMGEPVYTHMLGMKGFQNLVKETVKPMFIEMLEKGGKKWTK